MTQVDKYRKTSEPASPVEVGHVQCHIYHLRDNPNDEFSSEWFLERAVRLKALSASDSRPREYTLWRDVTPKTANYFHDSQFSGESWLLHKALEKLIFENEDDVVSFLEEHNNGVFGWGSGRTQTVIGLPDVIL